MQTLMMILIASLAPAAALLSLGLMIAWLAPRTAGSSIEARDAVRFGQVLVAVAPVWLLVLVHMLRGRSGLTPPPVPASWVPAGASLLGYTSHRELEEQHPCESALDALTGETSGWRPGVVSRWVPITGV